MRPLQPTVRQLAPTSPDRARRPRRRTRVALLAALLGATALSACGGGDDAAPASAAASQPGTPTAHIKDFAFAPSTIEAKVGEKITWTNDDAAAHTVTATSGAKLDSGTLARGDSFSFKPTEAGTIAYICAIHPSMKGKITVR